MVMKVINDPENIQALTEWFNDSRPDEYHKWIAVNSELGEREYGETVPPGEVVVRLINYDWQECPRCPRQKKCTGYRAHTLPIGADKNEIPASVRIDCTCHLAYISKETIVFSSPDEEEILIIVRGKKSRPIFNADKYFALRDINVDIQSAIELSVIEER